MSPKNGSLVTTEKRRIYFITTSSVHTLRWRCCLWLLPSDKASVHPAQSRIIDAVPDQSFQAVVLVWRKGLTESLPISSTAHLKVVPVVLGLGLGAASFTAVGFSYSIASPCCVASGVI